METVPAAPNLSRRSIPCDYTGSCRHGPSREAAIDESRVCLRISCYRPLWGCYAEIFPFFSVCFAAASARVSWLRGIFLPGAKRNFSA